MIAPADLTAPVRVAELELSEPIQPIPGCLAYRAVRILLRGFGRPLGWMTIEDPGAEVSAGRLREALLGQASDAVGAAGLRGSVAAEAGPMPPISVVVCTRDRAQWLDRCLASLLAVDYPAYEIVVVDNASTTGDTKAIAERAGVRVVREDLPGLDWARNRGIAEARHDIIAFTDDDVRVDAGWLRGLARAFHEPEVMLVTGLVAPDALETEAQIIFEYQYGGMGKGFRTRWWDPRRLDAAGLLGAHHLGVGANMALRREVLDRVTGFDTSLDVGTPSRGGGDLDFFHRVLVAGLTARYEPTALVWHSHRSDLAGLKRQLRDNGRAFLVYLMTQWAASARRPGAVRKGQVAHYAVFVWVRWLVGRAMARFRRREKLGLRFQLEELRGLAEGPWAYLATRRNDSRLHRVVAIGG